MESWTIYFNPSDYPNQYVLRKFILDQPTTEFFIANSLEEIRNQLPHTVSFCFLRQNEDDPVILETWI